MTEPRRATIARWLRAALLGPDRPDRIVVEHVNVDDKHVDVSAVAVEPETVDELYIIDVAEHLDRLLQSDANGLGGTQRYVLLAARAEGMLSRLPLCAVGENAVGDSTSSEPATPKGLFSQLMRHNEAQARMFAASMGQIIQTQAEIIQRQKKELEQHDARRLETTDRLEDLRSQQHERELAMMRERRRDKQKARLANYGFGLVSVFVNNLNGKKVFAEFMPMAHALKTLAQSMTREQLERMMASLDAGQRTILVDILNYARDASVMSQPAGPSAAPNTAPSAGASSPGEREGP